MAKNTITNIITNEGILHDPDEMEAHVVSYFTNLFCFARTPTNFSTVDGLIPSLVDDNMNKFLTVITSKDEDKKDVFNLKKDSSPGLDGFCGIFYHYFWSIIKQDVTSAVVQFFKSGWILPKYNSNNIILLPKYVNADSMDSFTLTSLANFKFKIITKCWK